jgi:hypothetical protein
VLRRCQICRGEMRFSHREYAGKGSVAPVWRCTACGALARESARAAEPREAPASRRKRQLVDEGPPQNPVISPDVAAKLLRDPTPDA